MQPPLSEAIENRALMSSAETISRENASSEDVVDSFSDAGEPMQRMRRVDWRWAAAKGFLNKDTNQWIEAMGGREAYIRQRNQRILARFFLCARMVKTLSLT